MSHAHYDPATGLGHPLLEHLRAVGELAAGFAERFGAAESARLAGLWHDLGKYARDFQAMIAKKNGLAHIEGDWSGGRVNHSSAGAVLAYNKGLVDVAFAIAGHHAGLADKDDLRNTLTRWAHRLDDAKAGAAPAELLELPAPNSQLPEDKLRAEMRIRMLFSALCDADFLDTERFYQPEKSASRAVPATVAELAPVLRAHLDRVEAGAANTEVNRVRREVRAACHAAAELGPGFFTLTVPTGGGKTLASLAFALDHCARHGLDRVIVAIPFTSIIEQTAKAFRDAFGEHGGAVLDHHSAFEPKRPEDETGYSRIATDNWDAPVVVTTTVQLFESLFANRTSRCRKLHRLAGSVIVLDEAQTLPTQLLVPILDALKALVADYGASVVICTATQPAFGFDPVRLKDGIAGAREIAPDPKRAFERLKRVSTRWPRSDEPTSYEALAAELAKEGDVLAVVHRRKDARELTERIDALTGGTMHLSALMCAEHRSRVLDHIKARKREGAPVRLVATQLVEAGVDLDFAVVYRALAGLDALAQAAGRCNREGKLDRLGELRVFVAPTEPPPGVLQTAKAQTESLLAEARLKGDELDLFEPDNYTRFFRKLYASAPLDAKGIQEARESLRFKTVAKQFQMIQDDWSAPIVVPYREGAERIDELARAPGPSREILRRLQRYTVTIPKPVRQQWLDDGRAVPIHDTVVTLGPGCDDLYDDRFGLDAEAEAPSLVV